MSFTWVSAVAVWIVMFALLALTGSGAADGWWLLAAVLTALCAPALLLRTSVGGTVATAASASARPFVKARVVSAYAEDDLRRWENDGSNRAIARPLETAGTA
jgi:hypothetical protein